jgi:ABC-2 type transport system ATP-binding protein
MRDLAGAGRTVFVSSHLMSEMALTAEHLVVIGRGRLIADISVAGFIESAAHESVRVRSPRAGELHDLLTGPGVTVLSVERGVFEVTGLDAAEIGERAAYAGIPLHELTVLRPSLEEAFMELTKDSVEYQANLTGAVR